MYTLRMTKRFGIRSLWRKIPSEVQFKVVGLIGVRFFASCW